MGFIIGTIFGSVTLVTFFSIYIYFFIKRKSLKRLIKKLGRTAEEVVNSDLKTWAKHTKNKFIAPAIYKYGENKVFEVDSILITTEAIIVVEIKSIDGGIKGDAKDSNWTKILGTNNFHIANPISQNEKHIKHIINMTGLKIPTISLIIFSNKAKFIDVQNKPGHVLVIKHAEVFDTLHRLTIELPKRLNEDDVKNVVNSINKFKANRDGKMLHKKITSGKVGK